MSSGRHVNTYLGRESLVPHQREHNEEVPGTREGVYRVCDHSLHGREGTGTCTLVMKLVTLLAWYRLSLHCTCLLPFFHGENVPEKLPRETHTHMDTLNFNGRR